MKPDFIQKLLLEHQNCQTCPSTETIVSFFDELMQVLFTDFSNQPFHTQESIQNHFNVLKEKLYQILPQPSEESVNAFFDAIPSIKHTLEDDAQAMYAGDPAARSKQEIIRCYPGFYAIAAYRIAHVLEPHCYLVARIITEHAHSKTGIDIHPSAQIGKRLCIDHGTGIVIGATTIIGNDVKIYQGVTLGALSVKKEEANIKRHPTIEDEVILYAGATILGGNTTIGAGSMIGGNVWLTHSVSPNSKIVYEATLSNLSKQETTS